MAITYTLECLVITMLLGIVRGEAPGNGNFIQCKPGDCRLGECAIYTMVSTASYDHVVGVNESDYRVFQGNDRVMVSISPTVWDAAQPYWCLADKRDKGGRLACINGTIAKLPNYWNKNGAVCTTKCIGVLPPLCRDFSAY